MHPTRQALRRFLVIGFFLLLPITLNYYSPYLMTSGTAERIASTSLFTWAAIFVSSPFVGRIFCGWGCPFNGAQTAWEQVGIMPLKRVRFLPAVKYALWALWVGAVIGLAVSTGGWTRVEPLYMTEHFVSIDSAGNLVTYYALVLLALVPAALGRRGFCRYLCPFGVWGIVGEKAGHTLHVPRLMLRARPERCNACGKCARHCPQGLRPHEEPNHIACSRCLECTGACKALSADVRI
jgi:polyferredoxin